MTSERLGAVRPKARSASLREHTAGPPDGVKSRQGTSEALSYTDRVYRTLREEIITLRLAPGLRVSQVKLAKSFQMSRAPLREALRLLERESFIDSVHNRMVTVSA